VAITTIVTGTTSAQPHGPPPAITPRMATTRASRSRPALSAMATPAMTLHTFRRRRDSSTEQSWHRDRSRGSRVIGLLRQPRRGDEFRRSSSGVIKGCWSALPGYRPDDPYTVLRGAETSQLARARSGRVGQTDRWLGQSMVGRAVRGGRYDARELGLRRRRAGQW
jgi:hypothetical protein